MPLPLFQGERSREGAVATKRRGEKAPPLLAEHPPTAPAWSYLLARSTGSGAAAETALSVGPGCEDLG